MRSLYLRVWLTVVAALALFALASGWLYQRQIEDERGRFERLASDRAAGWAELIRQSLPGPEASREEQAQALQEWSQRLRLPLALDDAQGRRIGASPWFEQLEREWASGAVTARLFSVRLEDGRTLWLARLPRGSGRFEAEHRRLMHPGDGAAMSARGGPPFAGEGRLPPPGGTPWFPPPWARGTGLVVVLALLFAAVALGAWPVVRRLTRRLEALQRGVERFGEGALDQRVDASGRDEVAAVAASFNRAAERIETLVRSNQSLLANASHELRSPLARLKMAVAMLDESDAAQRERLKREIHVNIAELDTLVEEVLLASRLDARAQTIARHAVDLRALALAEAARVGAQVQGDASPLVVEGDERLLRRALRNLLENARRYGGDDVVLMLAADAGGAELRVCDRGPGVPAELRARIFEPFFRLPGHAEQAGGVGLGLSLVRKIAQAHGGRVRCEAREGGGSCFVLALRAVPPA